MIVVVAEAPAAIVLFAGLKATVKSAVAAFTVTLTAVDVELA